LEESNASVSKRKNEVPDFVDFFQAVLEKISKTHCRNVNLCPLVVVMLVKVVVYEAEVQGMQGHPQKF